MSQLQHELDDVKAKAIKRLESEVYNKTVWQRLTDPIKRKQHSFINMVCATFAYILAYNLHLKSKAHKKAQGELEEERLKTDDLQTCLRSLLDEETLQEIATKVTTMSPGPENGDDNRGEVTRDQHSSSWWSMSSRARSYKDESSSVSLDPETLIGALRAVLEDRIGDRGLDDDAKKQKNIQRIWQDNQEKLRAPKGRNDDEQNDDQLILKAQLLLQEEENGPAAISSDETTGRSRKPKRLFDM